MNFNLLDVSIAKRRAWNRTDVTPPPVCFLENGYTVIKVPI